MVAYRCTFILVPMDEKTRREVCVLSHQGPFAIKMLLLNPVNLLYSENLQCWKQNCRELHQQANFSKVQNVTDWKERQISMHFEYPLGLKDMNVDFFIRRHAFMSLPDYQKNCQRETVVTISDEDKYILPETTLISRLLIVGTTRQGLLLNFWN